MELNNKKKKANTGLTPPVSVGDEHTENEPMMQRRKVNKTKEIIMNFKELSNRISTVRKMPLTVKNIIHRNDHFLHILSL